MYNKNRAADLPYFVDVLHINHQTFSITIQNKINVKKLYDANN